MNTSTSLKQRTRKLALLAFACGAAVISGPSVAASTPASAAASGTVIAPITVGKITDLSFGKFAPGAGGTVTISTSGLRTSGGIVPSSFGSTLTAAKFNVAGDADATYTITHSGSTALTNTTGTGAETMALAKFSDLTGADSVAGTATAGKLSAGGVQSIYVGGTLTVAANQVPGVYTGTVDVTVEYN